MSNKKSHYKRLRIEGDGKSYTSEDVARIIDGTDGWERATKGVHAPNAGGSHKYRVRTVTAPFVGGGDKTKGTYYVSSVRQFVHGLNQGSDFVRRVDHCHYDTIKGTYVTTHHIERVY